jgi:ABC-type dipeptide transport system, periplasmic component
MDPAKYTYQVMWRPPAFVTGRMAETYEFTTPSTWVVHLRHGIHWQNIAPANGREFVASDVVANYTRLFGLGGGTSSPYYGWYTQWRQLISVTTDGNYTVIFNWGTSNSEFINELVNSADASNQIVCPDAVKAYNNDLSDWHHSIGTGPFMVSDFISGSSATFDANTNYYGIDERHPQNKLPYAAHVKVLIMPEDATALAALRSGKIDIMYGMTKEQADPVAKTNPEILQIPVQGNATSTIEPRCDKTPFSDLKVREALQMAINLPEIAATYYGGNCSPYPSSIMSMYLTGWGLGMYPDWPQDLKDTYDWNVAGAKALLAQTQWPNGFHTDCVAISNFGSQWDLNLLQIVKDEFATINVTMDIRQMDAAAWTSYVRQTHSEDALSYGHANIGATCEPIFAIGMLTTNNSANIQMVSDPIVDAIYVRAQNATSGADFKQAVYDMCLQVAKEHYSLCLTTPNVVALCQPWLKGYNGQNGSANSGFYLSRFWVDQLAK